MSEFTDRDGLAAEYVLGTLEGAELAEARRLLAEDAAFRAAVAGWEERLAPLAQLAEPVPPPPDLYERIAATLWSKPPAIAPAPSQRALRWWQAGAVAALALAAAFAGLAYVRAPAPQEVAVLTPGGVVPVLVAVAAPHGQLVVRPSGTLSVPPDRDLELWALPPGATTPRPLGVLPATGRQLSAGVAPGTRILVSLEPKGGSPTGLPTGPVVYGGVLQRFPG